MISAKKQTLSKQLDQFYTNPVYADSFYNTVKSLVDTTHADILLEPSAGTGNFYNLLDVNKRIGLDLDPKCAGVINHDFLTWVPDNEKIVYTIGNPPFGKNSSLAVKFFNHAASFSEVIAFVIPRTFRKASIINRLHCNFHLLYDETVPDNSFIFNNNNYNVWCCAQIWVKKDTKRKKIKILKLSQFTDFFEIVEPNQADFSIQRVGGAAGLIRTTDFAKFSKQSHYFIKQKHPDTLDVFKDINFEDVKYNTAGNPSISPSEMLELWKQAAKKRNISITFGNNLFQEG